MFSLHPQLIRDTFEIGDLPLCRALLMNNRLFPWVILVPRVDNVSEIIDLAAEDRAKLMEEISTVSTALQSMYSPDKLNVGALGNQVPQLHIHVIARFRADTAWPQPVWGKLSEKYSAAQQDEAVLKLKRALGLIISA